MLSKGCRACCERYRPPSRCCGTQVMRGKDLPTNGDSRNRHGGGGKTRRTEAAGGPLAARFHPEHSLKVLFSGMSLKFGHGKPRLAGHQKTPSEHHFRESRLRWPVQGPKFVARSLNRM